MVVKKMLRLRNAFFATTHMPPFFLGTINMTSGLIYWGFQQACEKCLCALAGGRVPAEGIHSGEGYLGEDTFNFWPG